MNLINANRLNQWATEQAEKAPEFARVLLAKKIRRHITSAAPKDFYEFGISPMRELVDNETISRIWSNRWRLSLRNFIEPSETFLFTPRNCREVANIALVIDFLNSVEVNQHHYQLGDMARTVMRKFARYTFPQLIDHARTWFTMLGVDRVETEGTRDILALPDGFVWKEIVHSDCLRREAALMQNCLADGSYDNTVGRTSRILSLRGRNNMPHIDVCYEEHIIGLTLSQIRGKQNRAPAQKYREYILALINHLPAKVNIFGRVELAYAGIFYHSGNFGGIENCGAPLIESRRIKLYKFGNEYVGIRASTGETVTVVEITEEEEYCDLLYDYHMIPAERAEMLNMLCEIGALTKNEKSFSILIQQNFRYGIVYNATEQIFQLARDCLPLLATLEQGEQCYRLQSDRYWRVSAYWIYRGAELVVYLGLNRDDNTIHSYNICDNDGSSGGLLNWLLNLLHPYGCMRPCRMLPDGYNHTPQNEAHKVQMAKVAG